MIINYKSFDLIVIFQVITFRNIEKNSKKHLKYRNNINKYKYIIIIFIILFKKNKP